jgi:hypothetical protein
MMVLIFRAAPVSAEARWLVGRSRDGEYVVRVVNREGHCMASSTRRVLRPWNGLRKGPRGSGPGNSTRISALSRVARLELLEQRTLLSIGATAFSQQILTSLSAVESSSTADWSNFLRFDATGSSHSLSFYLTCDQASLAPTGTGEWVVDVDGLTAAGDPGSPELPQQLLRLALAPDADLESVSLNVLSVHYTTLDGHYQLAAAPVPVTDVDGETVLGASSENIVDGRCAASRNASL